MLEQHVCALAHMCACVCMRMCAFVHHLKGVAHARRGDHFQIHHELVQPFPCLLRCGSSLLQPMHTYTHGQEPEPPYTTCLTQSDTAGLSLTQSLGLSEYGGASGIYASSCYVGMHNAPPAASYKGARVVSARPYGMAAPVDISALHARIWGWVPTPGCNLTAERRMRAHAYAG